MAINLIVAVNEDFAIGNSKSNDLLYHIKDDLKRFRELTMGNYVVMGRTTFESLPAPLKGRTNVVLSRKLNYYESIDYGTYEIVDHYDLENVLTQYKESGKQVKEMFIIGGAQIYAQSFPYVDKIYLTMIHHQGHPDADVFFPTLELVNFKETSISNVMVDEDSGLSYHYVEFERL